MATKKSYNFSTVKFEELEELVQLRIVDNDSIFDDWLLFDYTISASDLELLATLIRKHKVRLSSYMEEDLKAKFIIPILNQVDFMINDKRDWYEATLKGSIGKAEFRGFVDYMVAKGEQTPKKPYFFIQEFKPSIPDRNPEHQLLAELLVAIEKNKTTVMRGGYIIGQNWRFVIVEKIAENQFEYFVSQQLDCLDIEDLKQIYIALQAVKHKYCID